MREMLESLSKEELARLLEAALEALGELEGEAALEAQEREMVPFVQEKRI